MNKKLDIKSVALALGVMWSLGIAGLSIVALMSEVYLHNIVEFLSSIYLGYSLSISGILIGMIWGFIDAAIGGLVFAWLYNKFSG